MPLPSMQSPPAIVLPAPGQEAEAALLDAFDWGLPLPSAPKLKGPAALEYQWLRAAAIYDPAHGLPASPFAAGRGRQEAEAFRRLLKAPKDRVTGALQTLPIRESGTALALWRWGQIQVRTGAFDAALRRTWEDRLLAAGPALTRGYALRHALCWALAGQDEARFAAVRSRANPEAEDTLKGFQRLFGLLGGPSPVLRLWTLPGLEYRDLRLDQLSAPRIWIRPAEEGPLPEIPAGTAWILPSASGSLDEREASLSGSPLIEGQALAARLQAAGRPAHFAPSRPAFERLGLAWFPILIELDGQGAIRSIRMGDAAPARP
ncbi:MAG: hypothetical protein Q8K67_04570 [Geothrix sp.]|nr:hypothetical protein [Geothrix sp.]